MDTNETLRAHISALVDGELPQADAELAFAALQEKDGKEAWDRYHLIRDTLRATLAPDVSPDFAERLAARLAQTPGVVPPDRGDSDSDSDSDKRSRSGRGSVDNRRNGVTDPADLTAILANPGTS